MKNYPVLRWIAILPASVIGYEVGYVFMKLIGMVSIWIGVPEDDYAWIHDYTLPLFASGVAGYCYLQFGVYVAPYYKRIVAIILIILLLLFFAFSTWAILRLGHYKSLVEIAGGIIGLVMYYKEGDFTTPNKSIENGEAILPIEENKPSI